MLIEFTRHSETTIGRFKIGSVVDLPKAEAASLVQAKKAIYVEFLVEEIEQPVEDEDGCRD